MNSFVEKEFWTLVIGGSILAMNSGFINVVALAGVFSSTVSHTTGNVTRLAILYSQHDYIGVLNDLLTVLSFIFGSFVSGLMVGDSKYKLGRAYGYSLLLESMALSLAWAFLRNELIYGDWCAAFACGLQNALAASYSGAVIRTTHMTGICTDIGSILGQACTKDSHPELWRLYLHVPILLSFSAGGFFGQYTFIYSKENALLVPIVLTTILGILYTFLPFIQGARIELENIHQTLPGREPSMEIRLIGDPRKQPADVFAKLHGVNVDEDIQGFLAELNSPTDENVDETSLLVPIPRKSRIMIDAGGSVEVLYRSSS